MSSAQYARPSARPVHYTSTDRSGGLKRLGISAVARVMRTSNHNSAVRDDLPKDLTFPPSSTRVLTEGAAHYGIMIPDLPEPHRFLAHMIVIGGTGFRVWDDNGAIPGRPRGITQLGWGTAQSDPTRSFHVFGVDETELADDGSVLRFGPDHTLTVDYPSVHLRSTLDDLNVALDLHCTDDISWVADSEIYRHYSLLCQYEGTIASKDSAAQQVSGTCTFEYGIGYAPFMDLPRMLPTPLKIPADFFTYHVLDLGPGEQIVACALGAFGRHTALMGADIRQVGTGVRRIGVEAEFTVAEFASVPTSYDGRAEMVLPTAFTWRFTHDDGTTSYIDGTVDTHWLYAGMGYIAGYHWHGEIEGRTRTGQAYLEYSDRRAGARR